MSDEYLKVCEIFYSLDGEGPRAGYPATFIRLAGCRLHCSYCDTRYANETPGQNMGVGEVVQIAMGYGCRNITLTGGEPLEQDTALPLVRALGECGAHVIIETNGSKDITPFLLPFTTICMDWKTPSSGMVKEMLEENLLKLRLCDVLKIVVSKEDLPFVSDFLERNPLLPCPVYLSPVWGGILLEDLAAFVKASYQYPNNLRMQLQMHKIIWGISKRGV